MQNTFRKLVSAKVSFKAKLFGADLKVASSLYLASNNAVTYLGEVYVTSATRDADATYVSILCNEPEKLSISTRELLTVTLILETKHRYFMCDSSMRIVDMEARGGFWYLGLNITQLTQPIIKKV